MKEKTPDKLEPEVVVKSSAAKAAQAALKQMADKRAQPQSAPGDKR